MRFFSALTLCLILSLSAVQGFAREYIVEAIVFTNDADKASHDESASDEYWDPDEPRVLRAQSKLAQRLSAVTELEETLELIELADVQQILTRSPEHRILQAKSWRQSEADYSSSPLVDMGEKMPDDVNSPNKPAVIGNLDKQILSGTIRIYAPNLLFAELNLRYAPANLLGIPDPTLAQYFIDEKRKLKLNEVHYFDHPDFGVILSVRPDESAEKEETQ